MAYNFFTIESELPLQTKDIIVFQKILPYRGIHKISDHVKYFS